MTDILNVNVGVLGHVDSGKTSLVRALSTELSTAALDKNPQSQERGITLDLGFSAFLTDIPEHLAGKGYSKLQFTLVDCPGHASLIKTIIGGAQIIDMMILVIDIVKGVQTQTAECLVVGEITTDNMIVVLNKVDLLPEEGRAAQVEKIISKIRKVLAATKFGAAQFVVLSAAPGGGGKMGAAAPLTAGDTGSSTAGGGAGSGGSGSGGSSSGSSKAQSETVKDLVSLLRSSVQLPYRDPGGPFLFAIDHCFPIKGQGTVMTGTVLNGSLRLNDALELPSLGQERKVKSMQMFKKPVQSIKQGDRAGICVTNLDAATVERGLACTPGTVKALHGVVALVKKIRFFKGSCESESKFHVTVGHSTVMATAVFFGAREMAVKAGAGQQAVAAAAAAAAADAAAAALVDEFSAASLSGTPASAAAASAAPAAASSAEDSAHALEAAVSRRTLQRGIPSLPYDWSSEWEWQPELLGGKEKAATPAAAAAAATATATAKGGAGGAGDASAAAAAASKAGSDVIYEWQWAALLFETPVLCPIGSLIIGSKLDADVHSANCRLAFYGRVADALPSPDIHELRRFNLYKRKAKEGQVDRLEKGADASTVVLIGRNLFGKEKNMNDYCGFSVHTRAGQVGVIEGAFGKGGKFKATFAHPELYDPVAAALAAGDATAALRAGAAAAAAAAASGGAAAAAARAALLPLPAPVAIKAGDPLFFRFRKYLYEPKGKAAAIKQTV